LPEMPRDDMINVNQCVVNASPQKHRAVVLSFAGDNVEAF